MRDLGPLNSLAPEFSLASAALAPLRARAERQGRGDFSSLWGRSKRQRPPQSAQPSKHASLVQGWHCGTLNDARPPELPARCSELVS